MADKMGNSEIENIRSQLIATATDHLARSIIVDAGSGTLRELLTDAARAISALSGDKDGDRLDYLDTLRGDMITGTSDDQELIGHDWVIYGQFYTVREAIDYGMMKRQEAIDAAIKEPGA